MMLLNQIKDRHTTMKNIRLGRSSIGETDEEQEE